LLQNPFAYVPNFLSRQRWIEIWCTRRHLHQEGLRSLDIIRHLSAVARSRDYSHKLAASKTPVRYVEGPARQPDPLAGHQKPQAARPAYGRHAHGAREPHASRGETGDPGSAHLCTGPSWLSGALVDPGKRPRYPSSWKVSCPWRSRVEARGLSAQLASRKQAGESLLYEAPTES
jgi:hypothetical protein